MSTVNKQKLFRYWSGKSDLDIIKQVSHKNDYHDLCMEFMATKNRTPPKEYKVIFKTKVYEYVADLLRDGLFQKSENLLKGFKYDVKSTFYQCAFECSEEKIRKSILSYLEAMLPDDEESPGFEEYLNNFNHLQDLKSTKETFSKWLRKLKILDLESLLILSIEEKQYLLLDIFFETKKESLIKFFEKNYVWRFLVKNEKQHELLHWGKLFYSENISKEDLQCIDLKYVEWEWSSEMIHFAMESLHNKNEALKNFFASLGFFEKDELENGKTIIRRLCINEKLNDIQKLLESKPITSLAKENDFLKYLLGKSLGPSLINPFNEEMPLIKGLLENDLRTLQGWTKLLPVANQRFQGKLSSKEKALISLFEILTDPQFKNMEDLESYEYLKPDYIPLSNARSKHSSEYLVYEALSKTKNIDISFFRLDQFHLMQKSSQNSSLDEQTANFIFYLKQCRGAYATYVFLLSQMRMHFVLSHSRIFKTCNSVASLIFSEDISESLVCHCIAFIEMLGFDSQLLRIIKKFQQLLDTTNDTATRTFEEFLNLVERNLYDKLSETPEAFPFDEYDALQMLLRHQPLEDFNNLILESYASKNDWWHFLLLVCFFETPSKTIQWLRKSFKSEILGEHFSRIFIGDTGVRNRRKSSKSAKRHSLSKSNTFEGEKIVEQSVTRANNSSNYLLFRKLSQNWKLDIFEIILLSESSMALSTLTLLQKLMHFLKVEEKSTSSLHLMENAIRFNLPVLALLSTIESDSNLEFKWLIYITVSTTQWYDLGSYLTQGPQSLFWGIVEYSVKNSYLDVLLRSFEIFFKDYEFVHFLKFLYKTQYKKEFNDEVINHLRSFMVSWSKEEIILPLCQMKNRDNLMNQSIRLLLSHIQRNFESSLQVQQLLDCICLSDISEICPLIDFMLLSKVYAILQSKKVSSTIEFNFENLLNRERIEYELILKKLREEKFFQESIRLALLLQVPVGEIIYSKWLNDLENNNDFASLKRTCEEDLLEFSLPPAMLVNFYLYGSTRSSESNVRKYEIMKSALEVIKQHHLFPNESFDRDQIEYETILCYIQIEDEDCLKDLPVYHSDYYEQIMLKERCVLYKSFMELKELACIDDITNGPKMPLTPKMVERLERLICHLLDDSDIVQALRIQELFECRPLDLRFIVYCMALAEDVTSIHSLPSQDRELLSDIEKTSYSKFNKRTLNIMRSNESNQMFSSNLREQSETSDADSTFDFEVFPSKEKRDILNLIQGIASKLKSGIDLGKRIVLAYRAAMHLDKEYLDILRTKDVSVLLNKVAEEECLNRILVVNDIISSTKMSEKEISDLLAFEITTAIIRPKFYIFNSPQHNKNAFKNLHLWGYNIDKDFHIFLELTPNSTLLGNTLLEYCDALKAFRKFQDNKPYSHTPIFDKVATIIARYGLPTPAPSQPSSSSPTTPNQVLSHKKQNVIYVELLIKAHLCFVHECSMEGIANILHRARNLNATLTTAKSWSLIVQMLIGIGRYREMFYCFDSLIKNEQFESLLGQFDYDKTNGLRQGILAYLREHNPSKGKEILKLAALHFLMYKELADMWVEEAESLINQIVTSSVFYPSNSQEKDKDKEKISLYFQKLSFSKNSIPKLKGSKEIMDLLNQAMYCFSNATENYLLDNKLILAQKAVASAELIAMQIDLLTKSMDQSLESAACVLNLKTLRELRSLTNCELSVPQSIILGRHYSYEINWCEAILCQYLILDRNSYLNDYLEHFRITDSLINNIINSYQTYDSMNSIKESSIVNLINLVRSVELKYKLASLFGLKSLLLSLVNDHPNYILKDTAYGQKKCFNFHDF